LLLKSHDAPKDALTRGMDKVFGRFFAGFNRLFSRGSENYSRGVKGAISRKAVMLGVYLVLVLATAGLFKAVPGGFVPGQDKQYLIGFAQLPDGATLDRTEDVIRKISDIAMKQPGVEHAIAFPGLSINGFTNSSNSGIVFLSLKPFDERKSADLSAGAIAGQLNGKFGGIQEAFIAMFPPPPVQGLGTTGGFKLQLEDRASLGYAALDGATKAFMAKAYQTPELAGMFSSFQVNVPQLYADIDRTKARQLGVPVTDVFDTMQIYLGSLYANDFNKFGRTYSVRVQADAPYRARAEDIGLLKVRSATGEMVPLVSADESHAELWPRTRHALQRLPVGRHQRRRRARLFVGSGAGRDRPHCGRNVAARHQLRVDRPDLPGNHCRQFRHVGVPAGVAAGLPGAGRAV
jgi:multidrug efflux pump